ncbi:MAG: membrane protein insertion efficiency factor YidD [Propionivibrio sp.]|jgi:putative membrane protein insertion efficiency factor|nr:membrane protein insertion efficiency factor YidD [Propionivibrio sp.]
MKQIVLAPIRFYQYAISPMFGRRCRFFPSCSEYTADAVNKYGVSKGLRLGLGRICRCHPWNHGGFDPLP